MPVRASEIDLPLGISEKELAEKLGVSRWTLSRLREREQIRCYRVGRRVVYGRRHVKEFLQRMEDEQRYG